MLKYKNNISRQIIINNSIKLKSFYGRIFNLQSEGCLKTRKCMLKMYSIQT